jgi:aspartokinase
MGVALKANRVVFFKDTVSLFEADPKTNPQAKTLSFCNYDKAINLMNTPRFALHPRAIDLAKQNLIPLHFCGVENPLHSATLISDHHKHLDKIDFTKPEVYE